jgi:hypothetical protein
MIAKLKKCYSVVCSPADSPHNSVTKFIVKNAMSRFTLETTVGFKILFAAIETGLSIKSLCGQIQIKVTSLVTLGYAAKVCSTNLPRGLGRFFERSSCLVPDYKCKEQRLML